MALAAAALVKPLAYPFAPLVLVETLRRFGPRRALRSAGAAGAVACVVFLPFLWSGHLAAALRALVTQVDATPYISVNAHNLWWLVGRGVPWTEAHVRPLALAAAESRPARTLLIVLTVTMLANMTLHDPFLTDWARPHTPGPHLLLPARLEPQLELQEQLTGLGYPWIVRQMRGESTLVGLLATLVNAQAVALTLAAWLLLLRRAGGLDGTLRSSTWPVPRWFWLFGAAFVVSTGAPFVAHVLRFENRHYFLLHFGDARIVTDDPARVGVGTFDVDGDRRPALWVHPPSEVRYELVPPPGAVLRTALALRSEAWSRDEGDGVQFEVRVEQAGQGRTLLSHYMDPKHDPADRRWEPVTVDLSPFSGRSITLTFATTGGPAGNIDLDWAGFADPSLETR